MITIKPEVCGICGACVAVCRQNALFLFNATLQVSDRCNDCKVCVKVCPLGAIIPERPPLRPSEARRLPVAG
jgi:MinD superfamily P-loop ATPase